MKPQESFTPPPIELESVKSVCDRIGMKKSWVYVRMKEDPSFPKPIKIGKTTRFVVSEITDWINLQIDASRGQSE